MEASPHRRHRPSPLTSSSSIMQQQPTLQLPTPSTWATGVPLEVAAPLPVARALLRPLLPCGCPDPAPARPPGASLSPSELALLVVNSEWNAREAESRLRRRRELRELHVVHSFMLGPDHPTPRELRRPRPCAAVPLVASLTSSSPGDAAGHGQAGKGGGVNMAMLGLSTSTSVRLSHPATPVLPPRSTWAPFAHQASPTAYARRTRRTVATASWGHGRVGIARRGGGGGAIIDPEHNVRLGPRPAYHGCSFIGDQGQYKPECSAVRALHKAQHP